MLTDERAKNCDRESSSSRRTVKLYRPETRRPDEGYAKYEENDEELERIRIKVGKRGMKRRER